MERKNPRILWIPVLLSLLVFLSLLIGIGIFLNQRLQQKASMSFTNINIEKICQSGGYETVKQCGQYYIGYRPCCDQKSDILDKDGVQLAKCGGLVPPTPPPSCIQYQDILKSIDQSTCKEFSCSESKFLDQKCKEGEYLKECKLGPCCCPNGAICD